MRVLQDMIFDLPHSAIDAAAERIAGYIRQTPVIAPGKGDWTLGEAVFKLELLQHTGSFKARGAFNRILMAQAAGAIPTAGVIAASGGNHGAAVAYAARRVGVPAEIFVPEVCPPAKIRLLQEYGATVNVVGAFYADSFAASMERAKQTGALIVHAYNQSDVLAGAATLGREFDGQAPNLETVFVAVGGGGLIAGVAAWYAGRARVIGVEPESAPSLSAALAAGEPVDVEIAPEGIARDSLGARRVGDLPFAIAKRYVDRVILVKDADIQAAQYALWDSLRIVTEPGGAAALAALLGGYYTPRSDERIGVVLCGANTNPQSVVHGG